MDNVREQLFHASPSFRRLHEEHQTCEARLDELKSRPFLTSSEQMEEKQIKKKKLFLKDRMAQMALAYEQTGAVQESASKG
jgi:uncharacterized protein YdcH (DUF465 family)